MTVPGHLVENGFKHVHGNKANARFDEPASQQAALTERARPVRVAGGGRLGVKLERVPRPGGEKRLVSGGQRLAERRGLVHGLVKESPSAVERLAGIKAGRGGIIGQVERFVGRSQPTRGLSV